MFHRIWNNLIHCFYLFVKKEEIPQLTYGSFSRLKGWHKNYEFDNGAAPAVIKYNWDRTNIRELLWYKDGKKHRDDGPAQVISSDDHSTDLKSCVDTEIWYKNGRIHREDGPAIIYYCKGISYDYFFFNGKPLSKEKWWSSISEQMKEKVIFSGNFY